MQGEGNWWMVAAGRQAGRHNGLVDVGNYEDAGTLAPRCQLFGPATRVHVLVTHPASSTHVAVYHPHGTARADEWLPTAVMNAVACRLRRTLRPT